MAVGIKTIADGCPGMVFYKNLSVPLEATSYRNMKQDLKHEKLGSTMVHVTDKSTGYGKRIQLKTFRLPSGIPETFFIDHDKSSVQVFPVTTEGKVVLVRQFRPGREKVELEFPGGGLEENENLEEAAGRELVEETGFEASKMLHVASIPYSPYSTGIRHSFLALGCKKTEGLDLDENEFLQVGLVGFQEFLEKIREASIRGFDIAYLAMDKYASEFSDFRTRR